ncbi:MAG: ABC transporter substrate-binding protein [Bauldia litoralis]
MRPALARPRLAALVPANLVLAPLVLAAFVLVALATAAPGARAAEKFTILLDWFVNPDHGPILVAKERGYFAEAGLDAEIIAPSDPNDPPRLVAAGKGDIAVSYQPQLHIMAGKGLPVVRVGTLVATPLTTLLVLKDGPIKSIADLKGKRIGYSVGGFETALMTAMLAEHGLKLSDVTRVNINFALSASLMSRKVDAVIGAYRNFELNQLDLKGRPGRAFYVEEHGVPPYDELIYLARKDRAKDPKIRAFIGAVERGVQYLVNYPGESWALFIKGREKQLDNELNRRAWRDTLPRFALRPAALDHGRYTRFAAFLKAQGVVKTTPPVASYAVDPGAEASGK